MSTLTTFSAKQLLALIQSKQVSCEEVMQAHLTRIEQVNPLLNAIVQQLPPEEALREARNADVAIAHHEKMGLLHGLPVTVKDSYKAKGFMGSRGNKSFLNSVAEEDSTLIARLRAAGAIILAVTNVPAFLMSFETDNLLYGRTNNPYDVTRTSGGSSGGQAAIIAAGGSPLGLGADAAGSIRQPAHYCGITGIKPTRNLLPHTGAHPVDGLGVFSYVVAQGPMARFIDDLIMVLPILAGPDEYDADVPPVLLRDPAQVNLRSLRVAFHSDNQVVTPTDDIINTIKNVSTALSSQVASIQEDCPAVIKETHQLFEELFFYGGDRGQWLVEMMESFKVEKPGRTFQELLNRAKQCEFSVTEMRNRLFLLDQFKIAMMNFMRNYDVIICPVTSTPAKHHETVFTFKEGLDLSYNLPYNVAGWPAVTVRCGTSKEGLPIGVQIIAKPWRDDVALAVAKRLEEIFGGWQQPTL